MRVSVLFILVSALIPPILFAQEEPDSSVEERAARYAAAAASIEADLESELNRLAEVRDRIATERPPLARQTAQIAAELREKRRQAELAAQKTETLRHEVNETEREIRVWREERTYIRSLLEDYRQQFQAQISLAELDQLRDDLETARADSASLAEELAVLQLASGRLEQARGGRTVTGKAVTPDGIAHPGTFIQVGPVSWFVSSGNNVAGLVTERPDLTPEIATGTGSPKTLTSLSAGEPARPVLDPTLGTALAIGEAEQNLLGHIRDGGIWIYPILFLALVAVLAALAKWIQIAGIRDLKPALVRRVLDAIHAGEPEQARGELQGVRHPARALLERGVEMADRSRLAVEEAMYEKFVEAQPRLQRGLPLIAIASATAPLLGLLGTVTGMIQTFELINIFGTGDARSLASGISEALVTTEFGLIVAIPALILHALLSRKVKGILGSMEMASLAFVNGLKKEENA